MPIRYRRYETSPEFYRSTSPVIYDGFDRTVSGGWGTAPVGGAWVVETNDGANNLDVSGSSARVVLDGSSLSAELSATTFSQRDIDLMATFSLSRVPVGASCGITLRARHRATPTWYSYGYRISLNSDLSITYIVERLTDDASTTLTSGVVPGVAAAANRLYTMRFQCFNTSPTTVRGRLWYADSYEPSTWSGNTTDSTAGNQTAGGVLVRSRNGTGYSGPAMAYAIESILGTAI